MFVAEHKLFWALGVQVLSRAFEVVAMVLLCGEDSGRWKLYVDRRFNGNSCVRYD
jgi:hypothetical protein